MAQPVPAPQQSPPVGAGIERPVWTCEGRELKAGGEPGAVLSKPLTVGEKFLLTCGGPAVALDRKSLSLQLPASDENSIRLLEARQLDAGSASFVATVYRTGDLKIEGVSLVSGAVGVRLQGLEFKVKSVIDPKANPEMKAYPPPPPETIAYPPWIWMAMGVITLAVVGRIGRAVVGRISRKRFAKLLAANPAAGTPYNQFNKEMRQLARRFPVDEFKPWGPDLAREYVLEVDKSFRWFLARELAIRMEDSARAVARAIRARNRGTWGSIGRTNGRAILSALSELARALKPDAKIGMTDGQQLGALCKRTVDAIEHSQRKTRGPT